jgi:hypothetical protein
MRIRTRSQTARRLTQSTSPEDSYRRAVERVESLRENQSGADKTWIEREMCDWRTHYARAVRVR